MRIESASAMSAIQKLTSGYRINSAKDDAAGLAISQKLTSQIKGYEKGIQNVQQTQDALSTAEGALGGINESLGRIRELAVQAKNGILTDKERTTIQTEIESLKTDIADQVKNTNFNTRALLDGKFKDIAVGDNPGNGGNGGTKVTIADTSLQELGIANFDVTKDFDLAQLDTAIERVSDSRSTIGAQSNRLDSALKSYSAAQENTQAAFNALAGADIAQEISNFNKASLIQRYQIHSQLLLQNKQKTVLDFFM